MATRSAAPPPPRDPALRQLPPARRPDGLIRPGGCAAAVPYRRITMQPTPTRRRRGLASWAVRGRLASALSARLIVAPHS